MIEQNMTIDAFLLFLLTLVAFSLSISVAFLAWVQRKDRMSKYFVIVLISVAIWSIMHGLQIVFSNLELKLIFSKLTYVGMTLLPPSWFIFTSMYTRNSIKIVEQKPYLLYIIPIVTLFLRLTDDFHHLVWSSSTFIKVYGVVIPFSRYGPWFWVFVIYSYSLVLAGSGILLMEAVSYSTLYKRKSVFITVAAILPIVFSFVYLFRICPFDLTPVSFSISSLFAFVAIYKLRLIEIVPIARDKVVENLADVVMIFDEKLKLVDLNKSAERFLLRPKGDVVGKSAVDIPLDEDILKLLHAEEERKMYGKNGKYYDLVVQSIKDKKGETMGKILIARDITDIKKYQDELEELNKNLEEKVKERTEEVWRLIKQRDEFIKHLGHDLRTPLTPILSLLPIIKEKVRDKEVIKLLDVISRNATYMKELVTDTLSLIQLSAPDYRPKFENINLSNIVEETLKENEHLIREKNIHTFNKIDESIFVKADKSGLKEIFANLISNSARFTPRGGRIEFLAKKMGEEVMVEVKDNGIGLTEDQKEKIFEEFYKADESRHDLSTSGLGLTVCKKIVERHGGRIWAESEGIGKGTSIIFTLPAGSSKSLTVSDSDKNKSVLHSTRVDL